MSLLLRKILLFRTSDPSIAVNITDAVDLNSDRSLDITNNSLRLTLKNSFQSVDSSGTRVTRYVDSGFNINFDEQDQIRVYLHYSDDFAEIESSVWQENTEQPSNNFLAGVFFVIDIDIRNNENDTRVVLECADKTYITFNKLLAQAFLTSDNLTVPQVIRRVIRLTTENIDGEFLGTSADSGVRYEVQANLVSEGGFIQDTRRSTTEAGNVNADTSFPIVSLSKVWKPVYEWLGDLSQIENINTFDELNNLNNKEIVYGRPFIYYIDEMNRFHWFEANNTSTSSIDISTTKNIYNYNFSLSVFDVINFIVFRGGEDFFGKGTLDFYLSPSTNARSLKMRVIAMTDIARTLIQAEIAAGNLVENTTGSFTFSGNRYNRNGTVTAKWNNTSYSTDADYNNALRIEISRLGIVRAQKVADGLGTARYKGTIEMKGNFDYTVGQLINLTNFNTGQNDIFIRIVSMVHNVTETGWFTTLGLEQDQEAIIESEG